MPKRLLDDPCATHPVISVDHRAHDRQYRHAVHKGQVVRTTNRSPLRAIVRVRTRPSQSVITAEQIFTLFLFFYVSNTTLESSDSPSPYNSFNTRERLLLKGQRHETAALSVLRSLEPRGTTIFRQVFDRPIGRLAVTNRKEHVFPVSVLCTYVGATFE